MTDKTVGFNIVVGGIPAIKSALKGVTESARDMNQRIQQMGERTAQRLVEIERTKAAAIKRISDSQVQNEQAKAKRILAIQETASRQVLAIKERESMRLRHMGERVASQKQPGGFNLGTMGHLAQAGGMYRSGHLIRMAGQLGVGSSIGGSGGGFGGMSGGMVAGVAGAFAAITVASKLVELGFQTVAAQAQFLATSFIGAVSQIGGAKNLQEILVDSSDNDREAANIHAASYGGVPKATVKQLISDIGKDTEWDNKNIASAVRKYQEKTGDLPTLEQGKFIANGASITGMKPEAFAAQQAMVKTQFKLLSDKEIQDVTLRSIGQGMLGTVEFANMGGAGKLTGKAQGMAGSVPQNLATLIGVNQLIAPHAGSPNQANTQQAALIDRLGKLSPADTKRLGIGYEKGSGKMMGYEGILENLVIEYKKSPTKTRKTLGGRSEAFGAVEGLAGGVDGSNEAEQRANFKKLMATATGANLSLEEFAKRVKEISETVDYQLKSAFNNVTRELGSAFLPVLQMLVPYIKAFAEGLVANKDNIASFMQNFIISLMGLVPVAFDVAMALVKLSSAVFRGLASVLRFGAGLNDVLDAVWNNPLVKGAKLAYSAITAPGKALVGIAAGGNTVGDVIKAENARRAAAGQPLLPTTIGGKPMGTAIPGKYGPEGTGDAPTTGSALEDVSGTLRAGANAAEGLANTQDMLQPVLQSMKDASVNAMEKLKEALTNSKAAETHVSAAAAQKDAATVQKEAAETMQRAAEQMSRAAIVRQPPE